MPTIKIDILNEFLPYRFYTVCTTKECSYLEIQLGKASVIRHLVIYFSRRKMYKWKSATTTLGNLNSTVTRNCSNSWLKACARHIKFISCDETSDKVNASNTFDVIKLVVISDFTVEYLYFDELQVYSESFKKQPKICKKRLAKKKKTKTISALLSNTIIFRNSTIQTINTTITSFTTKNTANTIITKLTNTKNKHTSTTTNPLKPKNASTETIPTTFTNTKNSSIDEFFMNYNIL